MKQKLKLCAFVPLCLCASSRASVRSVRNTSGFSLIEVLVAMAIMVVIIVMVTNMFRDSSEAWDTGTQRAEMNTAARAAVEYIARELSYAMAGSVLTSTGGVQFLIPFTLDAGSKLRFTAMTGTNGTLRGSLFEYDSTRRIIQTDHNNDSPYSSLSSWPGAADKPLITNVWRFEVNIYANENDMISGNAASIPYKSFVLPACVDISIEMLSGRDMTRALSPGLPDQAGFVMTNSRVYTTRVCFPNRGGGK